MRFLQSIHNNNKIHFAYNKYIKTKENKTKQKQSKNKAKIKQKHKKRKLQMNNKPN